MNRTFNEDITWQRLKWYISLDTTDPSVVTELVGKSLFGGWLMCKYPRHSDAILKIILDDQSDLLSLTSLPIMFISEDKGISMLYLDFADFCNQNTLIKKRVNKILIAAEKEQ